MDKPGRCTQDWVADATTHAPSESSDDQLSGIGVEAESKHARRAIGRPHIQIMVPKPVSETSGVASHLNPRDASRFHPMGSKCSARMILRKNIPLDEKGQSFFDGDVQPQEVPAQLDSVGSHPGHRYRGEIEPPTDTDDVGGSKAQPGEGSHEGPGANPPTEGAAGCLARIYHGHELEVVTTKRYESVGGSVSRVSTARHGSESVLIEQSFRCSIEVRNRHDHVVESQHDVDATHPTRTGRSYGGRMPNRLADETSPYLRQHQDNPVDWYPWGNEAFERALTEDKPILLSVGYSACHWCHVMAHESFEDSETAGIMNDLFVNVKVDREERPDVDGIYMKAVQATTGRGGWPMTVWLTPDGKPFFAGTYFPIQDRHGMPSFRRVMASVAAAWSERRQDIEKQADSIAAAIARELPSGQAIPDATALGQAYRQLESSFDDRHGGFGGAPKFPQQPALEFLARASDQPWAPRAQEMLEMTLDRMASGGIRDHVGGGFARYSVDSTWLIPHFEKMLYDNAQLARLYLRGWQVTGQDRFRTIAAETLEYMLRDLGHPDGGFFSAEDADSEGHEGKFYVWAHDEFNLLTGQSAPVAAHHFGVTRHGNFEGANHLHEAVPIGAVAGHFGITETEAQNQIEQARARLFEHRATRVRPGLDDKIVTAWNGLALRALAEAGAVLAEERYLDGARRNARFVLSHLRRDDGRLLRSWGRGKAGGPGFLDDYAGYAVGLFSLYQATGEIEWYEAAETLTRAIPELFLDESGSLFSTGADAEALITRPKDQMDNPLPSGASLAIEALLWLSLYTGEAGLREAAESAILESATLVASYPSAAGHLLAVLASMSIGFREVAVVGPEANVLGRVVWEEFRPQVVLAMDQPGTGGRTIPLLRDRDPAGETLAFVCEGFACRLPVGTPDELRTQLT